MVNCSQIIFVSFKIKYFIDNNMIKRLIFLFLFLPGATFAQLIENFDDGDISDWFQSTDNRWAASDISPLNGAFSLHHIFDNPGADQDKISISLPVIDLTTQNTEWRFQLRHNYDPSSGNNWGVFLLADADANQMLLGGAINGYVIGVNFNNNSDDILRLWKITAGTASIVITSTLNWQTQIGKTHPAGVDIIRLTDGSWEIKIDTDGGFDNLISVGTGSDNTFTTAGYFGINYKYSATADRLLWIDDIYVGAEIIDDIKPVVDSLCILSANKLKIEFSERVDSSIAANITNYIVNEGIGNPDSLIVDDSWQVAYLYFSQKFQNAQMHNLTVQHIEDLNSNVMNDTILSFLYEYIKPINVEVISSNEIQVQFSRVLDIISAREITNYTLDNGIGNPISAEIVVGDTTKIHLVFNHDFVNKTDYNLTIQDVADQNLDSLQTEIISFLYFIPQPFDVVINEVMADPNPSVNLPEYEYIEIKNTTEFDVDLTGWKLKVGSTVKSFPAAVLNSASYLTLCSSAASDYLDEYGGVLAFSSFPLIPNSGAAIIIYDENDVVIDSINFTSSWYDDTEKQDGGWSLERIDPLNTCSTTGNWKASEDSNGGTPGAQNSVYASNIDNAAPEITKLEIVSNNQLKLILNEPVTLLSLLEKTNYSISQGLGNPFSVLASDDLTSVDLIFLNSFPEKENLILTIENLEDECGNVMPQTETAFIYYQPQAYDIVINEIMADPDPIIGLPEFEYVEIYNTSQYPIDLTGWWFQAGTTIKLFPSVSINPESYLILCSPSAVEALESFGNVVGINGFPALGNTGQTLIIFDKYDHIISSVNYTNDWYKNDYKAEGGWSLEQIDPMNPCGGENNWKASENILGGTPGSQNSVFASNPDFEAPELLRATVLSENSIKLFFNESVDSTLAIETEKYLVNRGIGNPSFIDAVGPDYKSVMLTFNNTFENNIIYEIEILGGIFDCSGNEIATNSIARFSLPSLPEESDMVINEVLFNPLSGGYDFVELYNNSDKTIDLADVYLAGFDYENNEYKNVEKIAPEGFLLFPYEFIVITENPEIIQQQYFTNNPSGFIELNSMPSFNDDMGRVIIMDKIQQILDDFEYYEDMHFALLATNEGVSLERINYNRLTKDKSNWHSASELVGFATPAYENSQYMELEDVQDEVKIDPEIFSPDNDGYQDITNIRFEFSQPGYVANIKIFDAKGRLIRYLANNQLLSSDGIISWDGLDENNQKSPVGIYVIYIELFDLEGTVKKYKKSVVVATRW